MAVLTAAAAMATVTIEVEKRSPIMTSQCLFDDGKQAPTRVHFHFAAVGNGGRDILVERREHWQIGQSRTLHQNGVHRVEHECERYHTSRCHFVKHPRRSDAAFGAVEDQYFPNVGLA